MKSVQRYLLPTLIILLATVVACKGNKRCQKGPDDVLLVQNAAEEELVISLTKTPCFGACPIFTWEVRNDRSCTYEGKRFVDSVGYFTAQIQKADFDRIMHVADSIDYWSMNEQYDNKMVTDLPAVHTSIYREGKMVNVMNRYEGPKSLRALYEAMDVAISNLELVRTDRD